MSLPKTRLPDAGTHHIHTGMVIRMFLKWLNLQTAGSSSQTEVMASTSIAFFPGAEQLIDMCSSFPSCLWLIQIKLQKYQKSSPVAGSPP